MSMVRIEAVNRCYPLARPGWFQPRPLLRALSGVSMIIREGQTMGLVGESGSGKSTLTRCLLGLESVDSGRILYRDVDVASLDAAGRRVVVGAPSTGSRVVRLREVNWLVPPAPMACPVKLRARDAMRAARVVPTAEGADVMLDEPALAAPGQACVFYRDEQVLGGGFICAT